MFTKFSFDHRDVIASQQFSADFLRHYFFPLVEDMKQVIEMRGCQLLAGKTMVSFFYEESTRTQASFAFAIHNLGGQVVYSTGNARKFSSVAKGETTEDTIRVLCGYRPDVIVLRHDQEGGVARAAKVSTVPIINAGDGRGQHPTQAVLDLYTIMCKFNNVTGLKFAMVGDLENGRTVRSLCYLLGKYAGVEIYFVSPECARMKPDIKEYLHSRQVVFHESTDLRSVAPLVDVVYQTRVQTERGMNFDRNDHCLGYFNIDQEILCLMKKEAIILHPLPRIGEISPEVDLDPRAFYFKQAENAVPVRMAILKMLLAPNA